MFCFFSVGSRNLPPRNIAETRVQSESRWPGWADRILKWTLRLGFRPNYWNQVPPKKIRWNLKIIQKWKGKGWKKNIIQIEFQFSFSRTIQRLRFHISWTILPWFNMLTKSVNSSECYLMLLITIWHNHSFCGSLVLNEKTHFEPWNSSQN